MDTNGFGDDSERAAILKTHPGILSRVAERLHMSPAAVSRTFHGITRELNPKVVEAIKEAIVYAPKKRKR
jgi:hypothetical protein